MKLYTKYKILRQNYNEWRNIEIKIKWKVKL